MQIAFQLDTIFGRRRFHFHVFFLAHSKKESQPLPYFGQVEEKNGYNGRVPKYNAAQPGSFCLPGGPDVSGKKNRRPNPSVKGKRWIGALLACPALCWTPRGLMLAGRSVFPWAGAARLVWWLLHLLFPGPRTPGAAPHNPNPSPWCSALSCLPAQQCKQLLAFPYDQEEEDDPMAAGKD